MLIDLGRNDLGRVCEIGSVEVKDLMVIEKYSHVMHIVSEVEGILKNNTDVWDLLKDPKEIAEHVMLIDLGRNDLGRVCEIGTVGVKDLMVIEKYSHVMHIVLSLIHI